MKKLLKILMYFVITVLSLVIVLTVVAKLAENQIADIALEKVSETIEAPVEIENVSFDLLRKFPFATIELNGVQLGTPYNLPKTEGDDKLMSIQKIFLSVKSKPLLDGIIEIIKVEVEGADINYSVDAKGGTNIDFLMDTTQTTEPDTAASAPLFLTLKELKLKNIRCRYSDSTLKAKATVLIPEINVEEVSVNDDKYSGAVRGNIKLSDCFFEESNLHLMQETELKFDLAYKDDSASINDLTLITDGAKFNVTGNALMKDEVYADLNIKGSQINIGELIKYAPQEILKEAGLKSASGIIDFNTTVKGSVAENELPQVKLNIAMKDGKVVTTDYPALKNISFSGKMTNGVLRNNQTTQVDFSSFHFETAQSKFDLAFSVLDIDHPKYDVKTDMQIVVEEFKDFIPDSLLQHIEGKINAKFATWGEVPDSIGDDIVDYALARSKADIKLSDFNIDMDSTLSIKSFSAQMAYRPNRFKLKNLNISVPAYKVNLKNTSLDAGFSGVLTEMQKMGVDLNSFHIETGSNVISGSAKLKNLENPTYKFNSNIKLNLAEIKAMLPDSLVKELKGEFTADIQSAGSINMDSIEAQANDLLFEGSAFNLAFKDVTAEMFDDTLMRIEKFSGLVNMKPDTISINKLGGWFSGIEFGMDSTKIVNVYNSVLKNQAEQLYVEGNISLGDLDYALLETFMPTDTTATDSLAGDSLNVSVEPADMPVAEVSDTLEEAEPTNYTMLLKGKFSVNSIKYGKALISDISTKFKVTDSVYIADQFKLKAFNGSMNSSMKYSIKANGKNIVELHNVIEQMDIKKLLLDFDNFKDFYEPSVTHENLSGLFSTDMYSRFVMIGDSMVGKDMRVKGDLKLEDGGVYDFEPAMELARFTNINELDNIQFKNLDSKIFIFKNSVYVPKTYISSTAVDISAFGMQSMGDDFEYHLQLHLGDVLLGKSKKLLKSQSDLGDIAGEDERSAVYLIAKSENGKTKAGFDNKRAQSRMENKIRVQETMLKLVFHPKLVSFETGVK